MHYDNVLVPNYCTNVFDKYKSSVVDIWSLHPQPHLQAKAAIPSLSSQDSGYHSPPIVTTAIPNGENSEYSSVNNGNLLSQHPSQGREGTISKKHWGEVVVNPKKTKSRYGLGGGDADEGDDVFGALNVV